MARDIRKWKCGVCVTGHDMDKGTIWQWLCGPDELQRFVSSTHEWDLATAHW